MANLFEKIFKPRRHSKEIEAMLERGKERDNNEPIRKTAHQIEEEKKIAESMKINDEESLV